MITYNGSDLILAPIAGYSDVGFRTLCFRYGAGLCFTEMVSAKGLHYNNENTADLLTVSKDEPYTGVQLFGSEPDIIAEAIRSDKLAKFPLIDINMGCPVPKIVNNGEGSALMKDPDRIYNIVKAAVAAADGRPVTVKIRAGFYTGYENAPESASAIEEGGASMVTVHGRTREQFYSGKVNYDIIRKVKDAVRIPVCGNGDVIDKDSYNEMKDTGADYVMIARGSFGRPYIFAELSGKEYDFDIKTAIKEHISMLSFLPDRNVANNMKKHVAFYLKGTPSNKAIKEKIFACHTTKELIDIVESL